MGETTGKVGPIEDLTSSLEPGSSVTITPRSHLDAGSERESVTVTPRSQLDIGTQGGSGIPAPTSHIESGVPGGSATIPPRSQVDAGSEGGDEAAQIRSGIENTRADLSETINALQDKLDPSHIAEQVKEQIRGKATEAFDSAKQTVKEATIGRAEKIVASVSDSVSSVISGPTGTAVKERSSSIVQYIRENPIPLALVGIGIGMLTMSNRKKGSYSYSSGIQPSRYDRSEVIDLQTGQPSFTDRAKDAFSGVAETTRGAAGSVADKARQAAGQATGAVSSAASTVKGAAGTAVDTTRRQWNDVSDQARQGVSAAGEQLKSTLQNNPMALGIAAIAAGALLGLTLPSTNLEREYMGDARDHLMDQAKSAAQEAAKKVQHVAEEAGQSLKDVAQKEGLMGEEKSSA